MNQAKIRDIQNQLVSQYGEPLLMILNGHCLDAQFECHELKRCGTYVVFNEAMCVGEVDELIFSSEFIQKRCETHQVTESEYIKATITPLITALEKNHAGVVLWFDDDMFCQINVLTMLAYLEQIHYEQPVILVVFNHELTVFDVQQLTLSGYQQIYKTVLLNQETNTFDVPAVLSSGISRYLALLQEDNEIKTYIKNHTHLNDESLVRALLNEFSQYGLGDVQYIKMINQVR